MFFRRNPEFVKDAAHAAQRRPAFVSCHGRRHRSHHGGRVRPRRSPTGVRSKVATPRGKQYTLSKNTLLLPVGVANFLACSLVSFVAASVVLRPLLRWPLLSFLSELSENNCSILFRLCCCVGGPFLFVGRGYWVPPLLLHWVCGSHAALCV